jgi:eukaryotic translation initiation factor 2C
VISKATPAQYPLRKHFAASVSQVFTNHYEVNFKPDTRFFVYEILKTPTGKTRQKTKFILNTAINAWQFTKHNVRHFATDSVKTIVA